jgi:hypothetical protein
VLWPTKGSKMLGLVLNDVGLISYRHLHDLKAAQSYFEHALVILEKIMEKSRYYS